MHIFEFRKDFFFVLHAFLFFFFNLHNAFPTNINGKKWEGCAPSFSGEQLDCGLLGGQKVWGTAGF